MIVSLEKLTFAMAKIRKFAEGQKNVPGVMFDIAGDKMKVCYSDGKKSIIEIIDIEPGESVIEDKIVVPYVRIVNIIDICQPSGPVFTSDLDITFNDGNIMVIKAVKKVNIAPKEDEEEPEVKVVSKFEQKINFYRPEESIQYQALSRMDYGSIFESETFDVWTKEDLKAVLSRTSTEKSKVIYISAAKKSAFVVNLAHVTNIPISTCEGHGMTVATHIASALVEILSKMPGDRVSVCVKESRYANITSEDNSVGIWFEMAPASKTDMATLKRYQEKDYSKYKLTFCRPALQNVISCAMAADNNEKTMLTFVNVENGDLAIRIASTSGGSSVANDFCVVMENYRDSVGDIMSAKIPVSLKVLYDMIGNCQEYYVAMDIATDEGGTYICIGDVADCDKDGYPTRLATTHYTVSAK